MTLAQRMPLARPAPVPAAALMVLGLCLLLLVAALALVVWLGGRPITRTAASPASANAQPILAKADDPACAAALAKARDTRGLSAEAAVAAATAMLRACDVR